MTNNKLTKLSKYHIFSAWGTQEPVFRFEDVQSALKGLLRELDEHANAEHDEFMNKEACNAYNQAYDIVKKWFPIKKLEGLL